MATQGFIIRRNDATLGVVSDGPPPIVGGVAHQIYGGGSRRIGDHMLVGEAKLAFLDGETTGLSPAMGDRIVEIGVVGRIYLGLYVLMEQQVP